MIGTRYSMPSPLPPNPFPPNAFHVAYQRCLALEAAAPHLQVLPDSPPPIVCARLLGHLLRLAPAGNPQGQVEREITSATDDANLMKLAKHFVSNFIKAFRGSRGSTPAQSGRPSPPSLEGAREYTMVIMQEGGIDYGTAWTTAMCRGDNRCMLTGASDFRGGGFRHIEAAHIIPQATNRNIGEEGNKFHSAGVRTVLSMLAEIDLPELLSDGLIHRLENIMTLQHDCHAAFDDLILWLKPVEGIQDTYSVHEAFQGLKAVEGIPDKVTFSTTTRYPLPHPALLALHALCCEVAWMSGAAEYLMDIERRMDETRVLANDGSTADVLMKALALVET
ncbi:hypothetical protein BKA82DRAFT_4083748 [Pisolithus tinctorius]|nr:hypothetical protein BKA82DRAFT_4083748 [Pisolithus tinctorius]